MSSRWAETWLLFSLEKENGSDGGISLLKLIGYFIGYALLTMIDRSIMVGLISMPQCFVSMVSFPHIFCLVVFVGTGILANVLCMKTDEMSLSPGSYMLLFDLGYSLIMLIVGLVFFDAFDEYRSFDGIFTKVISVFVLYFRLFLLFLPYLMLSTSLCGLIFRFARDEKIYLRSLGGMMLYVAIVIAAYAIAHAISIEIDFHEMELVDRNGGLILSDASRAVRRVLFGLEDFNAPSWIYWFFDINRWYILGGCAVLGISGYVVLRISCD